MLSKPTLMLAGIILAATLLAIFVAAPESEVDWLLNDQTMGTSFSVRVSECPLADCDVLEPLIKNRLEELTQRLSHYEANSELSTFNNYKELNWFPVSSDLYSVIELAMIIARQSDGVFDITVAPAVNAWGFGPTATQAPPDDAKVARAALLTGFEKLAVRATSPEESEIAMPALRKLSPDVTLNLSAIAKGYAVDQLALLMKLNGIPDYMIEIGGEIRVAGVNSEGNPWRIGIEPPEESLGIKYIVMPRTESVATSGDYRNFYMDAGKRISHNINPATGRPVTHNLASVSVILPTAAEADGLATVLMVLGPEEGLEYAEKFKIPALFYTREADGFKSFYSSGFADYLSGINDPQP
jgi:thiamine biosynthesis lipoprotein